MRECALMVHTTRWKAIIGAFLFPLMLGCPASLQRPAVSQEAIQTEKTKQLEMAFLLAEKRLDRLAQIYPPLQIASAELCTKDVTNLSGFLFHNKDTYPIEFREIASRTFHLDDSLTVKAVHPLSSAAKSGLIPGDRILRINGRSLEGKSTTEKANVLAEELGKSNKMSLDINREGNSLPLTYDLARGCKYPALLLFSDAVNAISNGDAIAISSGMMKFAESDTELAFILSHEIAHNALGHNSTSRKVGKAFLNAFLGPRITQMTTSGYSQENESEADYAGLYIAARAGYDVSMASVFWRRMAAEHPQTIQGTFTGSHPSLPERSLTIEATIKEIQDKQRMGVQLLPEKHSAN